MKKQYSDTPFLKSTHINPRNLNGAQIKERFKKEVEKFMQDQVEDKFAWVGGSKKCGFAECKTLGE